MDQTHAMDDIKPHKDLPHVLEPILLDDRSGGHMHRRPWEVLKHERIRPTPLVPHNIKQLQDRYTFPLIDQPTAIRVDLVIDPDLPMDLVLGDLLEDLNDDFLVGEHVVAEEHAGG